MDMYIYIWYPSPYGRDWGMIHPGLAYKQGIYPGLVQLVQFPVGWYWGIIILQKRCPCKKTCVIKVFILDTCQTDLIFRWWIYILHHFTIANDSCCSNQSYLTSRLTLLSSSASHPGFPWGSLCAKLPGLVNVYSLQHRTCPSRNSWFTMIYPLIAWWIFP